MKRNEGAGASGGKPENRFAALTSGLLARKGHASPSNSPIADPAEETDAFALEPTRKQDKKKPPPAPAPLAKEALGKLLGGGKPKSEPAPARASSAAKQEDPPIRPGMTIINERSLEAGYPDNPSAEEIAALEAEADEVVSYFRNFGNETAVAAEKSEFYSDAESETADVLDELEDDEPAPRPWASASVPAVAAGAAEPARAGVSVRLTAREFVRLSLGAAELELGTEDLIAEAIEEYLDARGIASLGACSCLDALAKKR